MKKESVSWICSVKNLRGVGLLWTLIVWTILPVSAGDWSNWRGPSYDGASEETHLPERFSPTENVLWSQSMPGPDAATPIVIGNRIYVSATEKAGNEKALVALCLDRDKGSILWKKQVATTDRKCRMQNTWASPSPVSDGKRTIFFYGTGDLAALDEKGDILWTRNLQKDEGPWFLMWDYGASPLLYKDKLYISVMQRTKPYEWSFPGQNAEPAQGYLLCLDPATGKNLWKQKRPSDANDESLEAYTTPIPYSVHGREEILVAGGDYLTGHNPQTGAELWRLCYYPDHPNHKPLVPSPVVENGTVFGTQGKWGMPFAFAIPQEPKGEVPFSALVWTQKVESSDTPSLLYYRDRLYIVHDARKTIQCLNPKTGEQIWQGELGGDTFFRSSPVAADGKIYCLNMKGKVVVLKAGDEFKILSENEMGGGAASCATIAISDGKLFIRTSETLFCVGEKKAGKK
jgi:outer membrane protein assembly factor BamB